MAADNFDEEDFFKFKLEQALHFTNKLGKCPDSITVSLENHARRTKQSFYWLSYCDLKKPEGSRFVGVIIVKARDHVDADMKAKYLGIGQYGCEIEMMEIDDEFIIDEKYLNRMLSKDEAQQVGDEYFKRRGELNEI